MTKRALPIPNAVGVWTYWISRDSIRSELSGTCHLWRRKPLRTRIGYRVTWVNTDERSPGHLGQFPVEDIERWFGSERVPETDIMLMKVEQGVTPKMIQESSAR